MMKMSCCGAFCDKCSVYKATQKGDVLKLERLAKQTNEILNVNLTHKDFLCDGCKANKRKHYFAKTKCNIGRCCKNKGYGSCRDCKSSKKYSYKSFMEVLQENLHKESKN